LAADSEGKETVPLHIAHSSYFQMLKDTGLVGTIAFLGFLFLWFRNLSARDNIISRLCLASLICSYFHGIPHNFLINGSNSGMLLAILYAMSEIHYSKNTHRS
jgi:O-antigen ligase